ncbi:protein FAR-RED IMPAIRED RESPONSE 1-like [Silene latifolia]|uniref:protein FAR-RED IMPAIRED RESPONSE 1-like n=1 Tax=Silene latifolia TaxID=37657 RepID=UPI003D7829CA
MAHLLSFGCAFKVLWIKERYTQKSLDRDSDHSLPQTKTLLSLEVHASTVYTHALFYEFQQQCIDSLNSCSAGDSSREGNTRFLEVEDSIFNKTYTVAFNPSTFDATCSCKLFERKGYICKHIIWILSVCVEKLTKHQELEMLLGVKSLSRGPYTTSPFNKKQGYWQEVDVQERSIIAKAQKPKRFCNNCKQMAHHDKRNCPNPAVDTSQHSFDHESDISSLVDSD